MIERIQELLQAKGISPTQMMKDIGFSTGLFSQWKSGMQKHSNKSVKKIADYLDTTPDYLVNGTPYPTNAIKANPAARTPVQFWGKVSAGIGAYAAGVPLRTMTADASLSPLRHGQERTQAVYTSAITRTATSVTSRTAL